MFISKQLLVVSVLLLCLANLASGAARLPNDEVEALKDIGKTLGKTWNFTVDPCSGDSGWTTPNPVKGFENAVTCNCSFSNATICHVVSMYLSLSLSLSYHERFLSYKFTIYITSSI
eukprot:XP_025014098.1 probable leucine-rich repeat receptor-like serine/threonine-protein kinase At3g14840 [Ricinus communis]